MELNLNINPNGKLVEKDRYQGILAKYLSTAQGRRQFAQAMANPLRRNLDYHGIARKTFLVEPLPEGAALIYDKADDE